MSLSSCHISFFFRFLKQMLYFVQIYWYTDAYDLCRHIERKIRNDYSQDYFIFRQFSWWKVEFQQNAVFIKYFNSILSQTLQLIKNCCGNCVIMTLCTMKRMRKIWEYVKYKRLCLLTFIFFVCAYFIQFPYRCHSVLWWIMKLKLYHN